MKKFMSALTGIALTLAISPSAFAIISPYHQSVREIKAVTENLDVQRALHPNPIKSIKQSVASGIKTYTVKAGSCTVKAQILFSPNAPGRPGVRDFTVHVDDVSCSN